MHLFNRTPEKSSGGFGRREEQLQSRINELETFIETGPERARLQMEEEISTMPPPDDLADRRREHEFYAQLSRGEIRNELRYQTRGTFLFFLLASAIAGLSSWIYSFLQGI